MTQYKPEMPKYKNPYTKEGTPYVNRYGNPIVSSNGNETLAKAQIFASTKMFSGEDTDTIIARADKGYPINTFRDSSTAIASMLQEQRDGLTEQLRKDPINAAVHIANAQTAAADKTARLQDSVLGQYHDLVLQDPEISKTSPLLQQNAAAGLYLQHQMSIMADQAGVKDWAGLLLVPDISYRTAQFLGSFSDDKSGINNYTNSAKFIQDFSKRYQSLPPAQKVDLITEMKEMLPGITGNPMKQLEILMAATGEMSAGEINFTQWADKFDIATLGAAGILKVAGAIKKVAKSRNAVKVLSDGGNKDIAGIAADEILTTPDAMRKYGMGPTDAAFSADPRQTAELLSIVNAAPKGVATNVRNKLDAISDMIAEGLTVVDQGLGMSEGEKFMAREARVKYMKTKLNIDNVHVSAKSEKGFTLSYKTLDEEGVPYTTKGTKGEGAVSDTADAIKTRFVKEEVSRLEKEALKAPSKGKMKAMEAEVPVIANKMERANKALSDAEAIVVKGSGKKLSVAKAAKTAAVSAAKADIVALEKAGDALSENLAVATKQKEAEGRLHAILTDNIPEDLQVKITAQTEALAKVNAGTETTTTGTTAGKAGQEYNIEVPYTIDDVTGGYIDKEVGFMSQLFRPIVGTSMWAGADRNLLLAGYEQVDFASRKIGGRLAAAMNIATKGLNKKSIEKLNYFLEKGDDAGKIFSYDELVNAGVGGVRMSTKEYEAYLGTRQVMDNLWQIKNNQIHRDLVVQGVKNIDVEGTNFMAKPYDTVESAGAAYRNMGGGSVKIPQPLAKSNSDTAIRGLTEGDLTEYYNNGYKLVRGGTTPDEMFKSATLGHSRWALVKEEKVSNLSPVVLNQRTGYIPRAYKNANYFVKETRYTKIDGVNTSAGLRTLRYFDNIDDAEMYKKQLETTARASNQPFDPADIHVLGDRELTSSELGGEVIGQWGGLYSGYRTEEAVKFGLAGVKGARVSPVEAIQDYMQHISTRYPMAQYRMGMEQRWLNHVRDVLPKSEALRIHSFQDGLAAVENSAMANSAAKQKLIRAHEQITFMNRTPTLGDERTAGMVKGISERMSRSKLPGVKAMSKFVGHLNKSDPVAAFKTGVFHLYLGTYSFSQLFVQGMALSTAVSISPIHAAKGLTKVPGFAILDHIMDPRARKIALKNMAKTTKDPDLEEAYNAWAKSGLHESALITNADAYTAHKGLPMSEGAFSKFLEKGTMAYTAGELANLRTSFMTSYEKWKSINKGAKLDETGLKKIIADTEVFRMHMTTANKSGFQKGIMSIPTQFLQINVRFAEMLMGKEITAAEKGSFLMGQWALFGTAGIPFATYALKPILGLFGVDPEEMSETDRIVATRGAMGWLLNDFMDIDAVFTSRVAIGSGMTDTLMDWITGENQSVSKLLLGPGGGIVDSLTSAWEAAGYAKAGKISHDDLSEEEAGMAWGVIGEALLNVPSSTRNLMKAYYLQKSGIMRDKQGNIIDIKPNAPMRDVIAQAMGFGSQDIDSFWKLTVDNKKHTLAKSEATNIIMSGYLSMFNAAGENDEKKRKAYEHMLRATFSMFPNPQDHADIMKSIHNRMTNGKHRIDVELRKHIESLGSTFTNSANEFMPLTKKYQAQRSEAMEKL